MALRNIRTLGDEILTKKSKEVPQLTERTQELIGDMLETLADANGVGLAAPQVGVLKRIVIIDVSEEDAMRARDEEEKDRPTQSPSSVLSGRFIMINPVMVESDGEQTGSEGCLSVPNKVGEVTRPNHVIVKYRDREFKEQTVEAEELLARALCHELDHLDGKLYVDLVEGDLTDLEGND